MFKRHIPHDPASPQELTLRGVLLGTLITVIFTAANVYLGLKVGLTFSSAIPAAVVSMAVLRFLGNGTILENNMVQTQASAAGTLSSIIFILPGLVMTGHWQHFPYWQTFSICAAGGMLGVMFTIPLRRVMVAQSTLPYPEGVAAAEILRVGGEERATDEKETREMAGKAPRTAASGIDIFAGGLVAAVAGFATNGLRLLGEGINVWIPAGATVFRLSGSFSPALLGAGYLIGIVPGLAILTGIVLTWGFAVPALTAWSPDAGASLIDAASALWSRQVRFIGAGTIGIAAIWTLATLAMPIAKGIGATLAAGAAARRNAADAASRTDQDLAPGWVVAITTMLTAVWFVTFAVFLSDARITGAALWKLAACGVAFAVVFGFLVAAACGYMAGLVGSSASPISGIGIVAVILVSLMILLVGRGGDLFSADAGAKQAIAMAIFTTSAVVAIATISNDNLQDLKTGQLVGATPWRQQVALLIGCLVGAAVIPPLLDLLYQAYGFAGALPRDGMDPSHALSAPQATLMTALATGIFTHALDWSMLLTGIALGVALIAIDEILRRRCRAARLPVLAVGIGIYLPPTVGTTLVAGALLAWLIERASRRRAERSGVPYETYAERSNRRGVLLASGLIVGESLIGVLLAAVVGATGRNAPLAIVGDGFAPTAEWLGLAVFAAICTAFGRRVLAAAAR